MRLERRRFEGEAGVSGFIPETWRRLSDIRDEIGAEKLGAKLADGTVRAFYIDRRRGRCEMQPSDWQLPTAFEVMKRGEAFVRRSMPRPMGGMIRSEDAWTLYIEVEAPAALKAAASPSPPAGAAAGSLVDLARAAFAEVYPNGDPGRPDLTDAALHASLIAHRLATAGKGARTWSVDVSKRAAGRRV